MHDAYEITGDLRADAPFVFTCEHAGNRLCGLTASAGDRVLLDDHWGWDIGAAALCRALVAHFSGVGVLSRFSRLVCDPNRPPDHPTFILEEAGEVPVSFNEGLDEAERRRREEAFFVPYHAAIARTLEARLALGTPVHLLSIHSFTPSFLGKKRPMEIGVLFDDFDEDAFRVESALAEEGFESALNAPYSGREGLIYAAARHGRAAGVRYLELEVRQDLISTPDGVAQVAPRIARALDVFRPGTTGGLTG